MNVWIHASNCRDSPCLTLCFSRSNCFVKMIFARGIEGWIPSNMSLFLEVQIVQLIKIMAGIKNLDWICAFRASTTWGKSTLSGVCTWRNCQHCLGTELGLHDTGSEGPCDNDGRSREHLRDYVQNYRSDPVSIPKWVLHNMYTVL
jgi:hypothetical protein